MGDVQFGVPLRLCGMLKEALGLSSAVETGTYLGTSAAALRGVFPRVWSIELSDALFEQARARYTGSGLHFVHGSSVKVLPELLRDIEEPALFWLDGHWSAGETAGEDLECPVLHELAAIDNWPHATRSAVLIDDARYFLGPPSPPHDPAAWPTFLEILDTLRRHCDRYVTVLEDVIIAGPPTMRSVVEQYWLDRSQAQPAEEFAVKPQPSTPLDRTGRRRVASWARAAWADLPPSETLRRAARHLSTALRR